MTLVNEEEPEEITRPPLLDVLATVNPDGTPHVTPQKIIHVEYLLTPEHICANFDSTRDRPGGALSLFCSARQVEVLAGRSGMARNGTEWHKMTHIFTAVESLDYGGSYDPASY